MCGSALLFLRQTYEEGAQNFTCSVMRLCCMHGVSGRYPSGQRGQTVNLLPSASKVRILACPPQQAMRTAVVSVEPGHDGSAASTLNITLEIKAGVAQR